MAYFVHFFVVSTILAVTFGHPFSFGGGVSGKSHTEYGADGSAHAGLDKDARASGKARGFADWIGSLSGGAFVGNAEGKGLGLGGTLGSAAGAGIKAKGEIAGNGSGSKSGAEAHAGTHGEVDKEGHANVFGNLDGYDADKIKDLVDRNKNYDNAGYKNDDDNGYGARSYGSSGW